MAITKTLEKQLSKLTPEDFQALVTKAEELKKEQEANAAEAKKMLPEIEKLRTELAEKEAKYATLTGTATKKSKGTRSSVPVSDSVNGYLLKHKKASVADILKAFPTINKGSVNTHFAKLKKTKQVTKDDTSPDYVLAKGAKLTTRL